MKYFQPRGRRIRTSSFYSCTLFNDYWWCRNQRKWVKDLESCSDVASTNCEIPVNSLKAFRRRLKKWSNQLPKETEVYLVSKFSGRDIVGTIK